eukprot:TRINITY_DN15361_c0_g1_i3.p1 TRINITY_DN15361_c0_g1~~TRINITY_DN15361_c0_g1_i3.p1  ORF type:complete len:176 (-),score=21.03 TRINITY_DN15361_c0_g1_i3:202-729(-)
MRKLVKQVLLTGLFVFSALLTFVFCPQLRFLRTPAAEQVVGYLLDSSLDKAGQSHYWNSVLQASAIANSSLLTADGRPRSFTTASTAPTLPTIPAATTSVITTATLEDILAATTSVMPMATLEDKVLASSDSGLESVPGASPTRATTTWTARCWHHQIQDLIQPIPPVLWPQPPS